VSARHQVKRLDRYLREFSPAKGRSGRRNRFSSFGANPTVVRNFLGPTVQLPDGL
jgi:hypothetical protein